MGDNILWLSDNRQFAIDFVCFTTNNTIKKHTNKIAAIFTSSREDETSFLDANDTGKRVILTVCRKKETSWDDVIPLLHLTVLECRDCGEEIKWREKRNRVKKQNIFSLPTKRSLFIEKTTTLIDVSRPGNNLFTTKRAFLKLAKSSTINCN